jgi:hypothetical protein
MRGVPDIIVVKNGKFIGIEVKTKEGRLSDDQAVFGRACRRIEPSTSWQGASRTYSA